MTTRPETAHGNTKTQPEAFQAPPLTPDLMRQLHDRMVCSRIVDDVTNKVIQAETISMIERTLPRDEAEALVNRLQIGDISDEGARAVVGLCRERGADARTWKAH